MEERFETFTVLINRISRSIRKIKNQEMAAYQLRGAHVSCLYYLFSAGGITAAELCQRCEEDKAAISRALEYLEENGYLRCESQSPRRYKSRLHLTDKGQAVGRRIAARVDGVLEEISGRMTREERAAFYRSLSAVSDGLEEIASENNAKGESL